MDPIQHKILTLISENPNLSQRELAEQLGVSLGKINYCLKAVIEKGFIKVNNFKNSQNKMAYAYYLTPQGIEEKARITVEYIKRKILEYEAIQKELATLKEKAKDGSLEIEGITEELERVRL